jgi:hypothetical protein
MYQAFSQIFPRAVLRIGLYLRAAGAVGAVTMMVVMRRVLGRGAPRRLGRPLVYGAPQALPPRLAPGRLAPVLLLQKVHSRENMVSYIPTWGCLGNSTGARLYENGYIK